MKIIDVLKKEFFFEDNLTINEINDLYYSVIPKEKEDTILKMFDYIDKYIIHYDFKDAEEMTTKYQESIIGLLYNRYDFSTKYITLEDKLVEELLNTYINLRYSIYHQIIYFAYLVADGQKVDRKDYSFLLYAISSFNLERMYYGYIIKKNVKSTKQDIRLMNMVINHIYKNPIDNKDSDILNGYIDYTYYKKNIIDILKDDIVEKNKVLKK